jgi:hypothetical protein
MWPFLLGWPLPSHLDKYSYPSEGARAGGSAGLLLLPQPHPRHQLAGHPQAEGVWDSGFQVPFWKNNPVPSRNRGHSPHPIPQHQLLRKKPAVRLGNQAQDVLFSNKTRSVFR